METFRQGDVLMVPVASLPDDVQDCTPDEGRVIIMEGEATGHAHAFYGDAVRVYKPKGAARPTYLRVVETALLRHEEHETAKVPPGIYRIPQQSEYTPEELKRVTD